MGATDRPIESVLLVSHASTSLPSYRKISTNNKMSCTKPGVQAQRPAPAPRVRPIHESNENEPVAERYDLYTANSNSEFRDIRISKPSASAGASKSPLVVPGPVASVSAASSILAAPLGNGPEIEANIAKCQHDHQDVTRSRLLPLPCLERNQQIGPKLVWLADF